MDWDRSIIVTDGVFVIPDWSSGGGGGREEGNSHFIINTKILPKIQYNSKLHNFLLTNGINTDIALLILLYFCY